MNVLVCASDMAGISGVPWLSNCLTSSWFSRADSNALPSRSTMPCGVPAGAHNPFQVTTAKSFLKISLRVGMSGATDRRCPLVVAMARKRPDCTSGPTTDQGSTA
ncbi:Uncharacterised protein [Bordetella pertussis]|nr:Uncharacterised protein [Bordetella pertussis]